MYRRFSDLSAIMARPKDFTIRKYRPSDFTIVLIFLLAIVMMGVSSIYHQGEAGLKDHLAYTAAIVAALCVYCLYYLRRTRNIVNATEFQNALFAGAASMRKSFYLIVSTNDRSIMYFSPSFRAAFAGVRKGGFYTLDELLSVISINEDDHAKLLASMEKNEPFSGVFHIGDDPGRKVYLMHTHPIPRPKGFTLVSATDMEEQGVHAPVGSEAANPAEPGPITNPGEYFAQTFASLIGTLKQGTVVLTPAGEIEFINPAMESLLGYNPGELRQQAFHFGELVASKKAGGFDFKSGQFSGELLFKGNKNQLVSLAVEQQGVRDTDGELLCMVITATPAQPKAAPAAAAAAPAIRAKADSGGGLDTFLTQSPIPTALLDAKGNITNVNPPFESLSGYQAGQSILDLLQEDDRKHVTTLLSGKEKGTLCLKLEYGDAKTGLLHVTAMDPAAGLFVAQLIDTTEQKNLEMRFAHSQKMQAVGQLAGGIAHDFNNLLTAMIGFCDLLLMRHPAGDQSFSDIMQIKQNATRAANLVRQLLAFSRRQTLQPKLLDLTDLLADLSNLVRRLIGENIELKMIHGRDMGLIRVDQGQFEQVIINLAVNARDAMENGGSLSIRTSNVTVDRQHPIPSDLFSPTEEDVIVDGDYVLVEVIDTGHGIPKEILPKIFEPFFSTKEIGSGTGLGLATVYGIIKQTGGYIYVRSKAGEGTSFHLYFKSYQPEAKAAEDAEDSAEKAGLSDLTGKSTILLVEDETPVRIFSGRALRNKGYTVIEADSPESALELFEKHKDEIEIVVTDVIMPGMTGPAMVEILIQKNPKLKVVFISGYAEDAFVKSFGAKREFHFLPKPFTLKQLASKVKEVSQGPTGG